MKTFAHFLFEAVRQGLQTPGNDSKNPMGHQELHDLIHTGKVHIGNVTEKADGSAFHIHYDQHGFGTQYSGSGNEIMRSKEDYHKRAARRSQETGRPYNKAVPEGFGKFHESLAHNKKFQEHLKHTYEKTGKPVHIKGEAFNMHMGESHNNGKQHSWAVTKYDTNKMGKHGAFVVLSQMPGNEHHTDIEHLSDSNIRFHNDKIEHSPHSVDVKHEAHALKNINHELLNSRTTPSNKAAKEAEKEKVSHIGNAVQHKINTAVSNMKIKPKWSESGESEGFVVSPHGTQPRFKVLSPHFIKTKSSEEYKAKWAAKK